MSKFEVLFYTTESGEQPVKDFLLSLEVKVRAKVMSMISVLSENGYQLREPYSKHLSDGIFELRINIGNNNARVLFFFYIGRKIILTNGFMKKSKKTPSAEIDKAKKYRKDYLDQKEEE